MFGEEDEFNTLLTSLTKKNTRTGSLFTSYKFDKKHQVLALYKMRFNINIFHRAKYKFNSDLYVFYLLMSSFFQCQMDQTGGKPQNSPLITVESSFHGH